MTTADENAELRQQVAALTERLRHAQKLTAMGELVGTVTHEFNNVLMTIINYAKLGMRHRDQATRDKAFEKVFAAGNRAAKITGSVLAFARNRSSNIEPTDLARVIDDTLVLVEREMNKYRVTVDRQIQPAPLALANANQIQQVLVNLFINARQAMPGGGHVLVRLSHDPATEMVELTIRDSGCGIPPEKLPHIFEAFYTTKAGPDARGKGGTGLGLSLCRDIVEAHQGRIRVESTVGRGTAFTLKLPAAKSVAPAASDAAPASVDQPVGQL
ncbi:MAG: ATP-binding protein [Pirellulales bacterium]